jgi:hypothetical protein
MRPRQNAKTGVRTHRPGPEELVQTAATGLFNGIVTDASLAERLLA